MSRASTLWIAPALVVAAMLTGAPRPALAAAIGPADGQTLLLDTPARPRMSGTALADLIARYQAGLNALAEDRYDDAVELLRAVSIEAAAGLGETHSDTLKARSWLAFTLLNADRPDEAFIEAEAAEALALSVPVPNPEITDRIDLVLAVKAVRAGRFDVAEQRLLRILERNRTHGDPSRMTDIGALLGLIYRQQARDQEADQMLALAGGSTDTVVAAMSQLEAAMFRKDDTAILVFAERLLTASNTPEALTVRATVAKAGVQARRGDLVTAEAALRKAAADPRLLRDPIQRVAITDALADVLLTASPSGSPRDPHRTQEALTLLNAGIEISHRVLSSRHISSLQRRLNLGVKLLDLERNAESMTVYRQLLEEDAVEPGLLSLPLRTATELGLANILLREGQALEGYRQLRAAAGSLTAFALSSGGREEARGYVNDGASIFRIQVIAAWMAQDETRAGT